MWRKNVAGKRCLFIGADGKVVAALKYCFGWSEAGRVKNLDDVRRFAASSNSELTKAVQVIAVCLSKETSRAVNPADCRGEDVSANLDEIVRTAAAALEAAGDSVAYTDASEKGADLADSVGRNGGPVVLYFVEASEHTSEILVGAIEAGANAYFTYVRTEENYGNNLEVKLIYSKRGVVLNHQLAVSAVVAAQYLAPFQLRVMRCLRDDILTDREIAAVLSVSEKMVSKTIGQLFEIFGCKRRSALAKQSIYL